MPTTTSEVSLKFRFAPATAVLGLILLAPFGSEFLAMSAVFAVGLFVLCAMLSIPKSIDLMIGMVLALVVFGVQLLASVFLGIRAGGSQQAAMFTTMALWFIQLAAFGTDLFRFGTPVVKTFGSNSPPESPSR
ncbi:MAG: hypothetical protein MK085_12245 [Phycisphaerales bacterium]|nr:hypothetical protein [Phycisphaerales bacterium]